QASLYLPIIARGGRVPGPRRSDPAGDPRRADRARRSDALRALRAPGDEARARLHAAGDLAAPGRPRVGWPGLDAARGPVQVPPPRHRAAEGDHRALAHQGVRGRPMRIYVTSVLVDDQDKALAFYTEVLGFVKKTEIALGEARWLTVVSPDDPDG